MKWSFNDEFNYHHLHLAMLCRKFTQKQLRQEIKGLSHNRLSKILKGDIQPIKYEILAFSNILNFPLGFFYYDLEIFNYEESVIRFCKIDETNY